MAWGGRYLLPLPDSNIVPEALEQSLGLGGLRKEEKGRSAISLGKTVACLVQ